MRFMMLMIPKGYENVQSGTMPDPKAVTNMMKYNEAYRGSFAELKCEEPIRLGTLVR